MPMSRKADYSARALAVPAGLIVGLVLTYLLLTDWHSVPRLINAAVGSF